MIRFFLEGSYHDPVFWRVESLSGFSGGLSHDPVLVFLEGLLRFLRGSDPDTNPDFF